MKSEKIHVNSNGFGIIDILVSIGIMSVVVTFILTLLQQQFKDQKLLTQKFAMNDFKNLLITSISKNSNCTCQFQNNSTNPNFSNYANLHFDSTITDGSQSIDVGAVYTGCAGGVTPPILLAQNNQTLYGAQSLVVDTVKIVNLKPASTDPTEWQGQWEIQFKVQSNSIDRQVLPVTAYQKLKINNPNTTNSTIDSCLGTSSGTGTPNYLAKWSAISGILDTSNIFQEQTTGNIGIGTSTPQSHFEVLFDNQPSPGWMNDFLISRFENSTDWGPISIRRARGTLATPSNLQNGDWLAGIVDVVRVNGGWVNASYIANRYEGDGVTNLSSMHLGTSGAERVIIDSSGNVGIGTSTPRALLNLSWQDGWAINLGEVFSNLASYHSPVFLGFRGRGSEIAPSYPNFQDSLVEFSGRDPIDGYDPTYFGGGSIVMRATQNFSSSAKGTQMVFYTTNNDSKQQSTRMIIDHNGNIGIGATAPISGIEMVRSNIASDWDNDFVISSYGGPLPGGSPGDPSFNMRRARGTESAPLSLQANDPLAITFTQGHTGSGWVYGSHIQTVAETDFSVASRTYMSIGVNDGTSINSIEAIRIASNRNIGIGNASPSYKLDVSGDLRITGTPYRNGGDTAWIVPSDKRLKDITSEYTRGLSEIVNFNTIKFRYKENNPKGIDSSKEYTGVIAQEVQKQIPEAVKEDKDGFLSLNTTPIFWAMINAIKELYNDLLGVKAINDMQSRQIASKADKEAVEALKVENAQLKAKNQELERRLEKIEKALNSK